MSELNRNNEVKVVDHGGTFEFITHEHTRYLPAGIYYPSTDQNGTFLLSQHETKEEIKAKIKKLKKKWDKPSATSSGSLTSQDSPQLPQSFYDGSLANKPQMYTERSKTSDESEPRKPTPPPSGEDYDWVNQSYFPLEKYNPGLEEAEEAINLFLNNEDLYKENGINYRRSLLFYGNPGTGKSQYIINKCKRMVVNQEAVVVRVEGGHHLDVMGSIGADILSDCVPDRMKVIVIEEISEYFEDRGKKMLLTSLMDSAVLRDNVIFFATTNHPHEIPENIIDRPSRLDLLLGVFHQDNDPSYIPKFYEHLMGEDCPVDMSSNWIHQAHKELSPAYMKEMFIHSKVLGVPVEEGYKKLKKRRQLVRNGFKRGADIGF